MVARVENGIVSHSALRSCSAQKYTPRDNILREACANVVSFVFRAQSHAGMIKREDKPAEKKEEEGEKVKASDHEEDSSRKGKKVMDEAED